MLCFVFYYFYAKCMESNTPSFLAELSSCKLHFFYLWPQWYNLFLTLLFVVGSGVMEEAMHVFLDYYTIMIGLFITPWNSCSCVDNYNRCTLNKCLCLYFIVDMVGCASPAKCIYMLWFHACIVSHVFYFDSVSTDYLYTLYRPPPRVVATPTSVHCLIYGSKKLSQSKK
jgi:quinol-cytochrome oxidoreductase complex cytochrome b subunit